MGLSISEVRERTLRARHLMHRTRLHHFAVGAFNVDSQDVLRAICAAAKELDSPVLAEISHGEAMDIGVQNLRDMVDQYRRDYKIEMYLNLDHAPTVESCKNAIDAGFEFVHIDVSQANHNATDAEIIAATKEVVEYAKFTGAMVESEPHYFAGSSDLHKEPIDYEVIKKTFSTPEGASKFVSDTGIDTFAAAVGNLHGKYPVPKILDLDLLAKIRSSINCQISLHGGSGTPLHFFESAAQIGVSKVNINSDMRVVFRQTLDRVLKDNPDEYATEKLMGPVRDAVQSVVENKIKAFGSAGRAVL